MDQTFCLVVGLPGSGKSIYLDQLQKSGVFIINNPRTFEDDILPHLDEPRQVVAIADHNLCFSSSRESTVVQIRRNVPTAKFRWVYFENDPLQCLANLRAAGRMRSIEGGENYLWQAAQAYSIPGNLETRPVTRMDEGAPQNWPSYAPGDGEEKNFRLVRVSDDLVLFSTPEWEKMRPTVMYILQKYPNHRFRLVEEIVTRSVKDLGVDRLTAKPR